MTEAEKTSGRKLIFLDIDGTLTPAGSNVPPESALETIREARERGHRVFLCTGRNMAMLSPLLRYGFDGVVASAGGYVVCGDRVIYDCPMTEQQTRTAMEVLKKNNVFRTIEAKDATYGDSGLSDMIAASQGGNSELERWRKVLAEDLGIRPMEEDDGRPIYKVVIMCLSKEQLTEPRRLLEEEFEFCMQQLTEHANCLNGELINRRFDKGTGIRAICSALEMKMEDTVGFGDSMNDLAMLKVVGRSVCMGNGSEAVREMADLVCPAVEEDGLAAAFRELGLTGER